MLMRADEWRWIAPLLDSPLRRWLEVLPQQVERFWHESPHGDMPRWQKAIRELPELELDGIDLNAARVRAGSVGDCDDATRQQIRENLMQLHPWRKGPYEIAGLHIDTEWRSDWKWDRLLPHIQPLRDRVVLDVGCGNGYHGWRMVGAGARQVIGIDPTQLFVMQFEAMQHFLGRQHPITLLPFGIEMLPPNLQGFDTVFSMGVFYHRRSPFEHLAELKGLLRKGGELVLETLVIDGGPNEVLVPKGRYAKMRNVWFLPSADTLVQWMERIGFGNIRVVDLNTTSTDEQRRTDWMTFESLADYLDAENSHLTVEGYPAPKRAILVAQA